MADFQPVSREEQNFMLNRAEKTSLNPEKKEINGLTRR